MTDTRPRLSAIADYHGNRSWTVTVWEGDELGDGAPKLYLITADQDKEQSAVFQAMDKYVAEMT